MRSRIAMPAAIALLLGSPGAVLAQGEPADEPAMNAGATASEEDAIGGLEQDPGMGVAPPDEAAVQDDPGTTNGPDATIRAGESITAPDLPTDAPLDEQTVRAMLEAEGFTEVSDIVQDGNIFEARARRDGKPYTVRIDARTRTILEAQEIG